MRRSAKAPRDAGLVEEAEWFGRRARLPPFLIQHSARVRRLAVALGEILGVARDELAVIVKAAAYHDIGMADLPAGILFKPGPLDEAERALVATHPKLGRDILRASHLDPRVAEAVYQHHERISGTGYPRGLTAIRMTMPAKIIGVADVFAAMTEDRPYREAPGLVAAFRELQINDGLAYDSAIVDACIVAYREGRLGAS